MSPGNVQPVQQSPMVQLALTVVPARVASVSHSANTEAKFPAPALSLTIWLVYQTRYGKFIRQDIVSLSGKIWLVYQVRYGSFVLRHRQDKIWLVYQARYG